MAWSFDFYDGPKRKLTREERKLLDDVMAMIRGMRK